MLSVLVASAPGAVPDMEPPALVRADTTDGRPASPRRLFNAGLTAEERGDGTGAVARYMAARLVPRTSFADTLYARGAGLRLIRMLAGRDDDAAAAVAAMLSKSDDARPGTDLSPLVRSLLRRLDRQLTLVDGVIAEVRLDAEGGTRMVVVERSGARHVVASPAPVGPFSAGDAVRVLARQEGKHATLIAMARSDRAAWALMAVRGLSSAGPAVGALSR